MKDLLPLHLLAIIPTLYLWWELNSLTGESWWLDGLLCLIPTYILGWALTACLAAIYLPIANWVLNGFEGDPPPKDFKSTFP